MEDDVLGTRNAVVKTGSSRCDLCYRPVPDSGLRSATIDKGDGGSAEAVRVCERCHESLASEEVPYDAEIDAGLRAADE